MFETLQPASYGISTAFFLLSTGTILLRIYSRGFVVKSVGLDDWCMFAILVFNCGQQTMLYYFLKNGGGLHIDIVLASHPEWLVNLTYALFVEELYYIFMHWIIKMAFLLFYLRFASSKRFRSMVYATMSLNAAFTVAIWLMYCLQCIPLDAYFHKVDHPTVQCLDNSILYFVPAAFSITTDILIFILPIQPLWQIQTTLRKRIMLISIVTLGGVAVLVSMLRLIVLKEFEDSPDFTYTLGKMIIISSIEISVAIIAANGPSLKAVWVKHISKTAYTGKDQYSRTIELSGVSSGHKRQEPPSQLSSQLGNKGNQQSSTQVRAGQKIGEWNNESEEKLFKSDVGIFVTSSVAVEHVSARHSPEYTENYRAFDASQRV